MSAAPKYNMTYDLALSLVSEVQRRAKVRSALVDEHHVRQARYIRDRSRLKAALCTRRSGKSEGGGREMLDHSYNTPHRNVLYIGGTRDECKNIMWEPILKVLNDRHKLGGDPHETELSMRFGNGSKIRCLGVDAKPDEMKKVLGGKYSLVIIDEAAKYRINLRKLVYEMLKPATADMRGTISLLGTPDDLTHGLFYDVTRQDGQPRENGWSVHEWTAFDNPYMVEQWREEIEQLKLNNPRVEETPWFKRMFLGQWVIDTSKLVYKYDRERNWVPTLPRGEYTYGLGVDLGYDDDSAFVVSAYADNSRNLYFLKPYKQKGMIISDVAERIKYYMSMFPMAGIDIDGANKQAVEELKRRFQLPLTAAEKQGKAEFIEIMNSELIQGNIKLVGDECSIIEEEWRSLIWDEKKLPKKEEHPACPNHLSDSLLYRWRRCYQYLYQPKMTEQRTDEQKVDEWEQKEAEKLSKKSFTPFWMRETG